MFRLETLGGLIPGRKISAGEKLAMFMFMLGGETNGKVADRFNHSPSKTSAIIHEVAECILRCKETFMAQPGLDNFVERSTSWERHFTGCMGALDGSHIPAIVPAENDLPFINRKGFHSQNVLGVCNFNLEFTYILTGWEGSAHDSRVLRDAMSKGLQCPENYFYLADAGYGSSESILPPYRCVRYHLAEFSDDNTPNTPQEWFNYRHSQLRNVIERTWGVLKKRFPMLSNMHSYEFVFQCTIVACACLIHNFIRQNGSDSFFDGRISTPDRDVREFEFTAAEGTEVMNEHRDRIAALLWDERPQQRQRQERRRR